MEEAKAPPRARRRAAVLQGEAAECGLACLANVAAAYGYEVDLKDLRARFLLSNKGMTLPVILRIGQAMDLVGRALRLDVDSLRHLRKPAILHWNMNHFVVLERTFTFLGRTTYHVIDPASGRQALSEDAVSRQFTGIAVEFEPTTDFAAARLRRKVRITDLWSTGRGLRNAGMQLVAAAIISQGIYAVTPLFMQAAIDSVIPTADTGLLLVLAVIFAALVVLGSAASLTRGLAANLLGQRIGFQTNLNLVNHLLALPLAWFEKRQVADLISRLGSTQPISNFVGQQAFSVVVWLIGLLLYGAAATLYAWQFGALLLSALAVYLAVKMLLTRAYNLRNYEAVVAQTRQSGMLIENIEGIAAIKAFGAERQRLSLWTNARAEALATELRVSRVQGMLDVLRPTVNSVEEVLFVLLAIRAVLAGDLSIGMVFAANLYRQQAMHAGSSLIDVMASMRQLDVHLDRIRDIVTEPRPSLGMEGVREVRGSVELRNVGFSYGSGEPDVLAAASIRIEAGQCVAVIGRSGGGKTTLGKVVLGLLAPTSGSVLIDDVPLEEIGYDTWRSAVGYVAQDDDLFAGSLAENIAFFAPSIDMERVEWAARLAVIHDDIERMPMGYETLAGDMGSTLSGGQKARVLLARAIYRRPRLLLLDEGSAHLDIETEAALNASIGSLGATRILIAHRPETIRQADRIVEVRDGHVVERHDLVDAYASRRRSEKERLAVFAEDRGER